MKFISTNNNSESVSFLEAMRKGLAPDGGLYMPEKIPVLTDSFWCTLKDLSFNEIAFEIAKPYFGDDLSDEELRSVIEDAFNFPVPILSLIHI